MNRTGKKSVKVIKDYLKLSRLFAAADTFGAILLGAFTSTISTTLLDAIKIIAIGIFAHAYMGAINEFWHIEEDKNNPQFQYKPLVKGDIKKRNALIFILFCFIMTIFLAIFFYPSWLSLIIIILAAAFGTFYTVKGKYIPWAYDISPSIGIALLVIYGATATGNITIITIVAAFCVFFVSLYAEWIGGMKDADIDRKFNVPTTAVRWGYTHDQYISIKNPNLLYFIGIVISIDIIYSLPFLLNLLSPTYFYIFLFVGIPIQCYLIYKLIGKQNKESLRRHPFMFLGIMMVLAFVLVIDKITILGVLITLAVIFGWTYFFSLIGVRFSRD